MSNLLSLTSAQLNRAAALKDKIDALNKELAALLGSAPVAGKTVKVAVVKSKGKYKMTAAGRAKIIAAQKARWAKIKAAKPAKKVKFSAAARAKIAAAAKARWAKVKAAGKSKL